MSINQPIAQYVGIQWVIQAIQQQIDNTLYDVILCLLIQLPECIAYSMSNNGIKDMA